jgi:hypothetical protein
VSVWRRKVSQVALDLRRGDTSHHITHHISVSIKDTFEDWVLVFVQTNYFPMPIWFVA